MTVRVIGSNGRIHAHGKSMFHKGEIPKESDPTVFSEVEIQERMDQQAWQGKPRREAKVIPDTMMEYPTQQDIDNNLEVMRDD